MFLDKWEAALQEEKEVIVLGDINLDFLKWNRSDLSSNDSSNSLKPLTEELFSRIFPYGVSQLVTCATRVSQVGNESGLDHFYTNKPDKCSNVYTEYHGASDHKVIKVTRFSKSYKKTVRYVKKRSYKNFDSELFCEMVKQLSWFELYMCEDVDIAVDILTQNLTSILDLLAPIKTFQVHKKYAPWLSVGTKELMNCRDSALKKAATTRHTDDWRNYKNLRNTVTNKIRNEKKNWEKSKLDSTQHNPGALWSNVGTWLNLGNSGPPTKLTCEGRLVTSPARLATTMNNFFINKVKKLKHNIPTVNTDPLAKMNEMYSDRRCTFIFR